MSNKRTFLLNIAGSPMGSMFVRNYVEFTAVLRRIKKQKCQS